jgi:hypothetical protein
VPVQNIAVVSVRPDASPPPRLDLKDILGALAPSQGDRVWYVKGLDWLGRRAAESLCRQVDVARPGGVWLSSDELLRYAQDVQQTVEGEFFAFPRITDRRAINPNDLNLAAFPSSSAELAIVAVDGSSFDVLAKDPHDLEPLRALAGVRDEDARTYF